MPVVNIHKGLDRCGTKLVPASALVALAVVAAVAGPAATLTAMAQPDKGPRARTAVTNRERKEVRKAIDRAFRREQLTAADRDRYLESYASALRTLGFLGGQRKAELAYVLGTLGRIARAGRLSADRMRPLFLIVDRNREWWAKAGPPASGARLRFGASRVIFQYYPGHGLQLQPLANFGQANGYWQGRRNEDLRSLVTDLVELRVTRGGFSTWEYYFDFGGGSPPWISGMAQATAMQALARASQRLADPTLMDIARRARGAFEQRTPVGVRAPSGNGAWYALYSFAPRLNVLNGMLQSLIGLDAYASLSGDARAATLFAEGDRVAGAAVRSFDTGAWSLYNRPPGSVGKEADLNYHRLNRDFARRLCTVTSAAGYCNAADNFTRYLREPPGLRPFGPAPAPARGGRPVRFYFTLSKVGRVGVTIQDAPAEGAVAGAIDRARAARTYLSTSAPFTRGKHFFQWVPPRASGERTYSYTLFARDLAGNSGSERGTLRVKGRS
jgi:hypothetical protein